MYWPEFLILRTRNKSRKEEKCISLVYTQGKICLKQVMEWVISLPNGFAPVYPRRSQCPSPGLP